MCIFSAHISSVGNTKIFARGAAGGGQFLVYSMQYSADAELAMILPLPTPPSPAEDAVRFIDLSAYQQFFDEMATGFILPQSLSLAPAPAARPTLKVHEVGSFQASFVPQPGDFSRLDSQFRLPGQAWERLPQYHDYAFAVFKLQPGARNIHPMAFEFPRRRAQQLFYPTVHIHDGSVPARARFDHSLYCQAEEPQKDWLLSSNAPFDRKTLPAREFMKVDHTRGIVHPDMPIQMLRMLGIYPNQDVTMELV